MTLNPPLKLLISNDDGIFAQGVRTLANTLATAGHQVLVVCPDRERSAAGHGLTLHQPIRAGQVEGFFHPQVTAWSCSGTPADCVKFALAAVVNISMLVQRWAAYFLAANSSVVFFFSVTTKTS